jgi:hypothetical protein
MTAIDDSYRRLCINDLAGNVGGMSPQQPKMFALLADKSLSRLCVTYRLFSE